MERKWWHDKVAYQIYPKSFLDTNGDGIGDLRGIISKPDYLKSLGIDIIWLSPIYKSPFVDQGYDISDYYAIAEEFGTMEEFDELLAEAKKRDMHIIMDLVINHCSDKHEWFQKALKDPDGEYADYFYFRKGKNGNPPNNYRSLIHRLPLFVTSAVSAATVMCCALFIGKLSSAFLSLILLLSLHSLIEINKMSVELRSVNTCELNLSVHDQTACSTHTCSINHDWVH